MNRWLPRSVAGLLLLVLPAAAYSIWALVGFHDLFGSIKAYDAAGDVYVIAWAGLHLLHAAYWTAIAVLVLAAALDAGRRRRQRSATAAVLAVAAAASLVVTPLPVLGPFAYDGAGDDGVLSWHAEFVVAIGCWVVVGLGALVLAVRTWRGQPEDARPRP